MVDIHLRVAQLRVSKHVWDVIFSPVVRPTDQETTVAGRELAVTVPEEQGCGAAPEVTQGSASGVGRRRG